MAGRLFWLVTAVLIGCACAEFYDGLVVKSVSRGIDLTTHIVEKTANITLQNTGNKAATYFYIIVPADQRNHLASLSAASEGSPLAVKEAIDVKFPNAPFPVAAYRIDLPKSLGQDETVSLSARLVLTHLVEPFPRAIAQNDRQLALFVDNHYIFLPYTVKHQRTNVKLPSTTIESKSELSPTTVKGDVITYGPYDNVAPFAQSKLSVHYENNKPMITITRLNRDIEVSHWGNVAFEDDMDLQHDGAELKTPFSRFDYQRPGSGPSSVKSLRQVLPVSANEVYYRDEIGNISTSTFVVSDRGLELEFMPRFPLFGGWRTAHYMGYNLPSEEALSAHGSHYVLNVSLVELFDYASIDHLVVRIILPEGSHNIEVKAPFPVKGERRATHITYLDTTGRPVAIFEVDNVVPSELQYFQVHYTFSQIALLREPLILVLAFFLFFVFIMGLSRFELKITPSS